MAPPHALLHGQQQLFFLECLEHGLMLRSSRDSQQTGFAGVRPLATKLWPISERRFRGGGPDIEDYVKYNPGHVLEDPRKSGGVRLAMTPDFGPHD